MHHFFIIFINFLYMFRATLCSSSGGFIAYIQHLVLCLSLFLGDRSVHRQLESLFTVPLPTCVITHRNKRIMTASRSWLLEKLIVSHVIKTFPNNLFTKVCAGTSPEDCNSGSYFSPFFLIQSDTKNGNFWKTQQKLKKSKKKNYWQKLNHYNLPFKRQ